MLLSATTEGHTFHVFQLLPHPFLSSETAVHHLYTLYRGATSGLVSTTTEPCGPRGFLGEGEGRGRGGGNFTIQPIMFPGLPSILGTGYFVFVRQSLGSCEYAEWDLSCVPHLPLWRGAHSEDPHCLQGRQQDVPIPNQRRNGFNHRSLSQFGTQYQELNSPQDKSVPPPTVAVLSSPPLPVSRGREWQGPHDLCPQLHERVQQLE